jgi:5-methylthioadenosine/S-adenosylhomocysteine deaminase
MMNEVDLVIKNAKIYTMDKEGHIYSNAHLVINQGRIEQIIVQPSHEQPFIQAKEIIDADGKVIFPGFVNTHIHIFQSFMKGLGADHELIEWLNLSALPYGPRMTARQQYLAAQLASMEAIKTGCTSLAEFFYTTQDEQLAHSVIGGMQSVGIRTIFIRTFQDTGAAYGMPDCFIEPAEKAMLEVDKLKKAYASQKWDMVDIWTGPDVTWSTTKKGYQAMLEYCLSENTNYSMHILETKVDNEMTQKLYGENIVDLLENIGFLTDKMLAVHCVNLTEKDIDRFAFYGVHISHNPAANLYLGSGIPPIPLAQKKGVNISLGTDGAASNNTTNMLETLKLAALIQKGVHHDAAIIKADDILKFATIGGAKALHKEKEIGSIAEGKKADLIIFNPDQLISTPMHNPVATLVYSSEPANIACTIINGKIVYRNGKFTNGVDEQEVIQNVKREIEKLMPAHPIASTQK